MAKVIWVDLKADDPIFRQRSSVFTPMSKPSTVSFRKSLETSEAHKILIKCRRGRGVIGKNRA